MPKRKRDKHHDSDYKHIAKKLKKLERKMKHSRRHHRHRSSSSSESDTQSPRNSTESNPIATVADSYYYDDNEVYSPGRSSWYDSSDCVNERSGGAAAQLVVAHSPPRPRSAVAAPVTHAAAAATTAVAPSRTAPLESADAVISVDITAPTHTEKGDLSGTLPPLQPSDGNAGVDTTLVDSNVQPNGSVEQIVDLDSDLMEILGEDPTCIKEYGHEIQKDLAVRLNHIVTSGLTKENRKEIKEKYLIPANCKLIKAPTLNPEIRASLVESQSKRDKGIENKQNMTACALSSLSAAITLLLSSENKNPEILKLMMDTARILGDIQHSDSILRRFFILSTVKKDLKDQLEKTKIDEMLFGANLSDTLKSAKTISKSGADIRSASNARTTSQTMTRTPARPLNYRPPPANRRPAAAGAPRGARAPPPAPPPPAQTPRQTTTRGAPHGATRTWSRQPHTRYRR